MMCNVAIDVGTNGGDHGGGGARRKTCQVEDREGASVDGKTNKVAQGNSQYRDVPPRSVTS